MPRHVAAHCTQPTNAAAWSKNVAEGGSLYAQRRQRDGGAGWASEVARGRKSALPREASEGENGMHAIIREPSKSDAAAGDHDSGFQQHGSGTDRRGRTQAARELLRVRPIAGRQAADSLGAGDQVIRVRQPAT